MLIQHLVGFKQDILKIYIEKLHQTIVTPLKPLCIANVRNESLHAIRAKRFDKQS